MTHDVCSSSNINSGMRNFRLHDARTSSFSGLSVKRIILALTCAILLCPAASASGVSDPTGFWNTGKKGGVVEIFRCGTALCGRVADAAILRKNPKQADINNPDPALRSRAVRGLLVLKNFNGKSGEWTGGPLYDPDTGDSAPRGRLRLREANTLEVRGCILSFLCRTQVWTRHQDRSKVE